MQQKERESHRREASTKPDGVEKEPEGEMQKKEEPAGPGTNVAEGKTGTHGQRFMYFYLKKFFFLNLGLDD